MSRDNEIKKLMEAILQIDDHHQLAATNQFNYLAAMRGLVVMIEGFTGDPQCKDSQSIAAYCRSLHYLIDTSIADGLSMLQSPGSFFCNRWYLSVHVENFTLIHSQRFNAILIGMCMNRFFKCLTQQILTTLWVRDQSVN